MKRENPRKVLNRKIKPIAEHMVIQRLDESLPLQTEEWKRVEQILMRMSEFAPDDMIAELVNTLAIWADDQARRGYILGQEDLMFEVKRRTVA